MAIENNDIRTYLNQITTMERRIEKNLERIAEIRASVYGIPAMNNNPDKVQSSADQDGIGSAVCKMMDLIGETDIMIDALEELKIIIGTQIDELKDQKYRYILKGKYFDHKSIYTLANELKISDRWAKKCHKKALIELDCQINSKNVSKMLTIHH